jgi:PAS domain S-box-containing protein
MVSRVQSARLALAGKTRDRRALRRLVASTNGRLFAAVIVIIAIHGLRVLLGPSPGTGVSLLLVIPVTMVAVDHGVWAGALAGLAAYGVFLLWAINDQVADVGGSGHVIRASLYILTGAVTGWSAQHLRAAEARQRHLSDALGDMVSAHDPDGLYLYASSAAKELLGYEPGELVGTSAYDYFHPHDISTVRTTHDATTELPATTTAVYRVRRADGRYVWVETVSRAIRDGAEVVEILCSSRDVTQRETERLAHEEDRERLRAQVQQVLDQRAIEPVFQPIISLGTGEIVGYEALARFPLVPDRPPDVWFRQAADVGLGEALELLAIERAIEAFDTLPAAASLSVNASPDTLCSPRLIDIVRAAPADRLIVELTEHAVIADYARFNAAVSGLRERGIRLAVDDAGSGFASLRHILDVHPEIIKLDMALTRHIDRDDGRRALASALCDFAGNLGAQVIAEGIEEQQELDELLGLGIEYGQGYLLGRPGPVAQAGSDR